MLPRLVIPALPDALSRRRRLETWIYYAHWVMLLLALPWIVALHPPLWWLWLAATTSITFHNILRASLIHHGTIDQDAPPYDVRHRRAVTLAGMVTAQAL